MKTKFSKGLSLINLKIVVRIFAVAMLSCALLLASGYSRYSFAVAKDGSRGKNRCIALTPQEITDIIVTKLKAPGANVLIINENPVKGRCEIVFENKGRRGGIDGAY